jgi:hypothetical protein
MDPITTASTTIKGMSDIITAIKSVDKEWDAIQYKNEIIKLNELLLETSSSFFSLQETLFEKNNEIAALK